MFGWNRFLSTHIKKVFGSSDRPVLFVLERCGQRDKIARVRAKRKQGLDLEDVWVALFGVRIEQRHRNRDAFVLIGGRGVHIHHHNRRIFRCFTRKI